MSFIDTILKKFKVKEIVAMLFFTTLIITIMPNNILNHLGLLSLTKKYKTYISLVLILSTSYYLFIIFKYLLYFLYKKIFNDSKIAIKYFKNHISYDELELLIQTFYDPINNQFKTMGYIDFVDGRKTPLESKNIIYLSSQISNFCTQFSYNLQPYARDFLNQKLKEGKLEISNGNFKYDFS